MCMTSFTFDGNGASPGSRSTKNIAIAIVGESVEAHGIFVAIDLCKGMTAMPLPSYLLKSEGTKSLTNRGLNTLRHLFPHLAFIVPHRCVSVYNPLQDRPPSFTSMRVSHLPYPTCTS